MRVAVLLEGYRRRTLQEPWLGLPVATNKVIMMHNGAKS